MSKIKILFLTILSILYTNCALEVQGPIKYSGKSTAKLPYTEMKDSLDITYRCDSWTKTCDVATKVGLKIHNPLNRDIVGQIICVYYIDGRVYSTVKGKLATIQKRHTLPVNIYNNLTTMGDRRVFISAQCYFRYYKRLE